ncbi:hypothetical protein Emag_007839 [Eimeria magna]
MSSDDLEKLGPDEFLMSLAAEPSILHEDPPPQVGSAPVPDSSSSADLVLPSPHQQEVPDPKTEDSPAAVAGSSVDPAADDSPEEAELGFPLKEVPGRCPYAWSPPRRRHDRFGFYTGPPLTAQNPVERPIPFRPPHCPFGDPAALIPLRYFAVLPGPGYKAQAMEQFWIVKMSLRDVYREMCYDRACRQLYPGRFLRRYLEVFPEPPFPPRGGPYRKSHLLDSFAYLLDAHFRPCFSAYLDLHRSYCMARDREEEERILEDYDRRWFAFDPLCSEYHRRGEVNNWRDDPYYHHPCMVMVTEMTMERPHIARDLRVRFPYEVQCCPNSKAFVHLGIRVDKYKYEFQYAGGSYRRWFADPCPLV